MGVTASSGQQNRCPQGVPQCPIDAINSRHHECYTSCVTLDEARGSDICPVGFHQHGRACQNEATHCVNDQTARSEGRTTAQYCVRDK